MVVGGRLVVKHLLLENFKSYAGEKLIGPFHKGFNSILGPNGNGKSNVIEALLFVFGKRSRKLRTKRLSELIHKSASHQDAAYAKVTIHFEEILDKDGGEFEIVAGSQFSVSRVVQLNSRSEYLLNNGQLPFGQIVQYLKDKGFDVENNRFLILQGEVELIAQMKPKAGNASETGFLEYLEEIVGSDKHVDEINRLSEELEIARSKKDTMQRRLRAVEEETKQLENGKDEAERYLRKTADILSMKIQRNCYSLYQLKKKVKELEQTLQEVENAQQDLTPVSSKLKEKLVRLKASLRLLEANCEKFNQDMEALSKELSMYECRNVELQTELKHTEGEITQLSEKDAKIYHDLEMALTDAEKAETDIKTLQLAIKAMKNNLLSQEQRLNSLEEEYAPQIANLDNELTKARLKAAPFRNRLVEIEGTLNIKKVEYNTLKEAMLQSENELQEIQQLILLSRSNLKDRAKEIKDLQLEITKQEKESREFEVSLNKEDQLTEKLEAQLEEAELALSEAKKTTESLANQNEKMKVLLQAKTSGSIPGIIGRLGDLGCTEAMYDIAVSSCCPALDYILVETVEDAEAAGELLKQKQLSALTFIILSKQKHLEQRMQAPFQPPEGAIRLFDVLHIQDKRWKCAFYFAFRDILVTESLDTATKIASRKRCNLVTLNGEIVSASGAMTGGGKPIKGKMRLGNASTLQVIHQSEAQLLEEEASTKYKQLSEEYQEKKEQMSAQKEQLNEMKKDIDSNVAQVRIQKMEMESEDRNIMRLEHSLQEKQQESQTSAADSSNMNNLEQTISSMEQQWTRVHEEAKECFSKVTSIEEKIENIAGGAISQQKAMIKKIKDEVNSSEMLIVQHQWTIENLPHRQQQLQDKQCEIKHQKELMDEKLQPKRNEIVQIEETCATLRAQRDKFNNVLEVNNNERKNTNQQIDSMMEEMNECLEKEEELQSNYNQVRSSLEEGILKENNLKKEIDRYRNEFSDCLPDEELPSFEEGELQFVNIKELNFNIEESSKQLDDMEVNLNTVYQYREKKKEFESKSSEFESFTQHRNELLTKSEKLKAKRLNEFLTGFHQIRGQLKKVYRLIANGGDADLDLIDSLDPFSEGIEFSVRPPTKSWKKIANLSGGEKTLSSLSLIFALHYYRPTMLYIMDEIDAALDFKNVAIAAEYIAKRTGNAQFIVVSLRNQMFDRASRLIGIYKINDCTHSVTIDPKNCISQHS